MSEANEQTPSLAVFCDYENLALGARDAQYDAFNISMVLERLLDKGKIVVKKAYCDWDRYRAAKRGLHEAAFELIEIPHVSYSGKNSADIRLCVDALDLCHTKAHIDIFVVVSGDSDFSPLVSKLRENSKTVVGVGVKNSSSELLIENCDEFIFYDELIREKRSARKDGKRKGQAADKAGADKKPAKRPAAKNGQNDDRKGGAASAPEKATAKTASASSVPEPGNASSAGRPTEAGDKEEALEMVLDTVEALFRERDDNLWGSMVKQTLKRKKPHFSETYFGYGSFNELLEDAEKQGLLEIKKDQRSGGYLIISFGPNA